MRLTFVFCGDVKLDVERQAAGCGRKPAKAQTQRRMGRETGQASKQVDKQID